MATNSVYVAYIDDVDVGVVGMPTGSINVTSTPAGATVLLDGSSIGVTPISNYGLVAGPHTLDISLTGYTPTTEAFTIAEGQTLNFNYPLVELLEFINVTSTPAGATVLLDGTNIGVTPISSYGVSAGPHTLDISLTGYTPSTEVFTILEGETQNFNYTLTLSAYINVTSTPVGADVLLDSVSIGVTPISNHEVSAGPHTLDISLTGYQSVQEPFTIAEGQTSNFDYPLTPSLAVCDTTVDPDTLGLVCFESGVNDINSENPVSNPIIVEELTNETFDVKNLGQQGSNCLSWMENNTMIHTSMGTYFNAINSFVKIGYGMLFWLTWGIGATASRYRWYPDKVKLRGFVGTKKAEGQYAYINKDTILYVARVKLDTGIGTIEFKGTQRGDASSTIEYDPTINGWKIHLEKTSNTGNSVFSENYIIATSLAPDSNSNDGTTYSSFYDLSDTRREITIISVFTTEAHRADVNDYLTNWQSWFDYGKSQVESWLREAKRPTKLTNKELRHYYINWHHYWMTVSGTEGNWNYSFVPPANKGSYAGQWIWDSGFAGLGLIAGGTTNRSWQLAENFSRLQLTYQRADGLVPRQIEVDKVNTNIWQPPGILTWLSWEAYQKTNNLAVLQEVYPKFKLFNEWVRNNTDSDGNGLYRWSGSSGGWDNSPRYDTGSKESLDLDGWILIDFMYLKLMAEVVAPGDVAGWDTLYNTLKTNCQNHWDVTDQAFYDLDTIGSPLRMITPAEFWMLLGNAATPAQASVVASQIYDPTIFNITYPLPTVATSDPAYDPTGVGYSFSWRGPTWINVNMIAVVGLLNYGLNADALYLIQKSMDLVSLYPFAWEDYNGEDGTIGSSGGNAWNYMWTAAGYVYMALLKDSLT